jgi:hypothetical protein
MVNLYDMFVVKKSVIWYTRNVKYFIIFKEEIKMKNLAKAGICALALTAAFSFASADDSKEYSLSEGFSIAVQDIVDAGATSVTFSVDYAGGEAWGGGCVGYNLANEDGSWKEWTQVVWANDDQNQFEDNSYTVNVADLLLDENADSAQTLAVQVWWNSDPAPTMTVTYNYADSNTATLAGTGYLRVEEGVYRVNLWNTWANADLDQIVAKDYFTNVNKMSVTFTVSGLADAFPAGTEIPVKISANSSDWSNCQTSSITITEDGQYTIELDFGDAPLADTDFTALIFDIAATDADVAAFDDKDTEDPKTLSWNVVIDQVTLDDVVLTQPTESVENPVEETPAEETPAEETPAEETPATEEETPAADDTTSTSVASTDSTPNTADATPVAAMAVLAVVALAGVVVSKKTRV